MLAPMEDEAEARNGRPYGDAGLGQVRTVACAVCLLPSRCVK